MSSNIEALATLLALVKENPELISEMQSGNVDEMVSKLEAAQAAATAAAEKAKQLAAIDRRTVDNAPDAEKVLGECNKFASYVAKTFKVKEQTPISSRWHVTVNTSHGKMTVSLQS